MNIAVCCKFVPDLQDMEVGAGGAVNFSRAKWEISEYDLQAVEAGVRLAKETGGKLTAVSVGGTRIDNSQLKKDLLSRGPQELYLVADDALANADAAQTAAVLADVVRKLDVDLVLCGEGSADNYAQQVGLQLGERLGWITFASVNAVTAGEGTLTVERALETETETLEFALPAVLSVTSSINEPPRPGMKDILMAGKKPVITWSTADVACPVAAIAEVSTLAPESRERAGEKLEGSVEEAAAELVRRLKVDGLL